MDLQLSCVGEVFLEIFLRDITAKNLEERSHRLK